MAARFSRAKDSLYRAVHECLIRAGSRTYEYTCRVYSYPCRWHLPASFRQFSHRLVNSPNPETPSLFPSGTPCESICVYLLVLLPSASEPIPGFMSRKYGCSKIVNLLFQKLLIQPTNLLPDFCCLSWVSSVRSRSGDGTPVLTDRK